MDITRALAIARPVEYLFHRARGLFARLRRRRRDRKTAKVRADLERAMIGLLELGIRVPGELLELWFRLGEMTRREELERRVDMLDEIVADVERAGLTVRGWQVAANFDQVNFGFSSDLDIEILIPDDEEEEFQEVAPRLARRWWQDGKGLVVKLTPHKLGETKFGLPIPNGYDFVYGWGTS